MNSTLLLLFYNFRESFALDILHSTVWTRSFTGYNFKTKAILSFMYLSLLFKKKKLCWNLKLSCDIWFVHVWEREIFIFVRERDSTEWIMPIPLLVITYKHWDRGSFSFLFFLFMNSSSMCLSLLFLKIVLKLTFLVIFWWGPDALEQL